MASAAELTSNQTKQLSSAYLQNPDEVQTVFDRFDANGDGKISAEEFIGVMNALSGGSNDVSADEAARMMEEIDTDRDGYINLKEFAAFCNGESDPYGSSDKELREAFELYDQDRDGRISKAELHLILTRLGERCSVDECAGMIKSVDADGDGFVSFEEFRKMMTTAPGK